MVFRQDRNACPSHSSFDHALCLSSEVGHSLLLHSETAHSREISPHCPSVQPVHAVSPARSQDEAAFSMRFRFTRPLPYITALSRFCSLLVSSANKYTDEAAFAMRPFSCRGGAEAAPSASPVEPPPSRQAVSPLAQVLHDDETGGFRGRDPGRLARPAGGGGAGQGPRLCAGLGGRSFFGAQPREAIEKKKCLSGSYSRPRRPALFGAQRRRRGPARPR